MDSSLVGGRTRSFHCVVAVFVACCTLSVSGFAHPSFAGQSDASGGPQELILEGSDGIPSLAYHRMLTDGRVLDFERRDGAIYDAETGSRWNASGLAVEGELAGVQLAFVTSFFTEWYGWAAFHPDTTIFGSDGA